MRPVIRACSCLDTRPVYLDLGGGFLRATAMAGVFTVKVVLEEYGARRVTNISGPLTDYKLSLGGQPVSEN